MRYIVAVYLQDLAYGGPEEGGWYYGTGKLVRVMEVFRSEEDAISYCRRLNSKLESRLFGPNEGRRSMTSVLSEGEYRAEVHDDFAPQYYPKSRPRYE